MKNTYSDELVDRMCERLADGESLRSICRDDDMPCKATVFNWLRTNPAFAKNYERALEARADSHADDLVDIADDASNDWMERNDPKNPGWIANGEHINRSRLRIDARKWVAAKLRPKKYGEKLELASDPKAPFAVSIQMLPIDEKI